MIKAIDFNEKSLGSKVFRSFLMFKIMKAKLIYCSEIIERNQKKNEGKGRSG